MPKYDHQKIEAKWQKYWAKYKTFSVKDESSRPNMYVLDMFPYPSAHGLHVGHPEGYTASDILTRFLTMRGFDVLHPMGWDAFGLPAENYAIKTGTHPKQTTEDNIKNFKRQIQSLGFAYDWDREINTTDPNYYKWTQWIFLKLWGKGLAYEAEIPINWCPQDKTGLANEEVVDGKCDRCGTKVELKNLKQWLLKITDYADRLLDDLEYLDWPEPIKLMQRNWIGKSYGANVDFKIKGSDEKLNVFTTRPDTLFGATYIVVAPEHQIIHKLKDKIDNYKEVAAYIEASQLKTDIDRTDESKIKTGVELKGVKAVNPVNNKEILVWVADYVLISYGTGAIMAVPAHDARDFEFATKFGLKIIEVVRAFDKNDGEPLSEAYVGEGEIVNSDFLDGLEVSQAKVEIIRWLEEKKLGQESINYKLRDWVFSRQRYWGEPIPLIHCEKCGVVAVPESDLPLLLPEVEKYEPTGTGESPLAGIDEWVNTKCPKCKGNAKRETNTMPQWAGSSWYWLRYIDPHNKKELASKHLLKKWLPVDVYVGGAEHAVLHLLYGRFWHKFLCDIGVVPKIKIEPVNQNEKVELDEPFLTLKNQGLILGEDGEKMSKSRGNVINPDEIIKKFGADTMRVYEMFMGPFEDVKPWSTNGLVGARRFLDKVWALSEKVMSTPAEELSDEVPEQQVEYTIKKVTHDIDTFNFNTAISQMMILVNMMTKAKKVPPVAFKKLILLLSPFAPHMCEEIWQKLGHKDSLARETWPTYDEKLAQANDIELVLQVNGKVRDKMLVDKDITQAEAENLAQDSKKVQTHLTGREIKNVIFVPGRLINFVTK